MANLELENNRLTMANICPKCQIDEKQIALYPCGHVLCQNCAASAYKVNCCPVLSQPLTIDRLNMCASYIRKQMVIQWKKCFSSSRKKNRSKNSLFREIQREIIIWKSKFWSKKFSQKFKFCSKEEILGNEK